MCRHVYGSVKEGVGESPHPKKSLNVDFVLLHSLYITSGSVFGFNSQMLYPQYA